MPNLNSEISKAIESGFVSFETNKNIVQNLNPKLAIRPYQAEAFARFNYYFSAFFNDKKSFQLLFHMATGSGKTLVMAGLILDLYERGYRNFIFFVHSNNIIEKTKDNFLNSSSSKYLFNNIVSFADKKVQIAEVENLEAVNLEDINIVFTTVQGLHLKLNTPRENALNYEDFADRKVVLLSDEAHHINADTKKGKLSKDEQEEIFSWESTVNKIFKSNSENLLLEFTATADLENENLKEKYLDKLIFDYPLKQFRIDQYSKEVQLLQADLEPFERALQAVLLSVYRRKIFEDFKKNIKPVILFKSKTIADSINFFEEFAYKIENLKSVEIEQIRNKNSEKIFVKIFDYFKEKNISLENLLLEIKEDFCIEKCISVNSKNDSDEKQLLINNLEDVKNEYRVVFAVDKLNEGWDVLNLFDIVRLYNTKDSDHKAGKIGKTTMSEAQLIGRGARYCPFQIDETQALFQRKYDDNLQHPLRICEELYYHSTHNPKYISELNKALEDIGLKPTKEENLRQNDKKTDTTLEKNKKANYKLSISELPIELREKIYTVKFSTGYSTSSRIFEDSIPIPMENTVVIYNLLDFGEAIIRKAINKLIFYRFDNLQKFFPKLLSMKNLITDEKFLKDIKVKLNGPSDVVNNPTKDIQLKATISVLQEISENLIS
ncbi:DEAD/DEAH box helicase family protein [Frigoriflavimonas asaccharolytica]|uniref:Type III restriction enzyme n=1 Tax=Frigoriflavimonas asaccharolytica TaxID=2735899 RepID=A0A8J8GA17_9FLAO|nr:DEAD/DEAH box helicase family protein [Frigoriflavimonas asaccharolytica]NRS92712.1 type III restriction enzyme [Frigoriflavimonas asaccharolytica]